MSQSMSKKYKTIYLDPAWNESGGGKVKRGADRHYPLLKTDEIIKIVSERLDGCVADNAHCYLWVTNNFLEDGLKLLKEIGFRYVTNICWAKPSIGLGQYFRGQHEICLFGVKGKLPSQAKPNNVPTLITANKARHSQKPGAIYRYMELTSPAPRIELFARRRRVGWDVWGNESISEIDNTLEKFI
jgi:N6-adenosine-specific RNA methylase IME4